MNCKRSAVGAVALGNHLYVCGGFDGISSLDTVERWACDLCFVWLLFLMLSLTGLTQKRTCGQ